MKMKISFTRNDVPVKKSRKFVTDKYLSGL